MSDPGPAEEASSSKRPFSITRALRLVREAVKGHPRAGLFELRDQGHGSVFELLVACVISIRTRDEVMIPTALRLFARARTPAEVAALSPEELLGLIKPCTYAENKVGPILAMARAAVEEHGGALPADREVLMQLHGVGPKCANLAVGVAGGEALIGVDTHVHRITNRWGYVQTKRPEQTLAALEKKLPARFRVEINELLVPFGKHVCTPTLPRCSTCPVLDMCRQVGVKRHR